MALFEDELQKIYDSEINVEISWFWDSGITVKLGDRMNGYLAQMEVKTIAEIIPWLQRAIATHMPTADYVKGLGFTPTPLTESAQPATPSHRCPICGEINVFPGWTEMPAFICKFCGEPVTVLPAVQ